MNLDHIETSILINLREIEQNLRDIQDSLKNTKSTKSKNPDIIEKKKYKKKKEEINKREAYDTPNIEVCDNRGREVYDMPEREVYDKPTKKKKRKKKSIGIPFSRFVVDTSSSSEENI